MKPKLLLIAFLVFCVNLSTVEAQLKNSELGIGVLLGGSKLVGDLDNTNMGPTGGLMLRYVPIPRFALTGTATYGKMTSGLNAIRTNILSLGILGAYYFMPQNYFRPFVSLGLSRFHYTTRVGGSLNGSGSPIQAWKGSLQLGIGFELFTGNRWAVTTMGNYNITLVDDLDAIGEGSKDGFFHGLIGLVHYFKTANDAKDYKYTDRNKLVITQKRLSTEAFETVPENILEDQFAEGIYFKTGTAVLLDKSKKQLHEIYRYLYAHPDEVLELLGITGEKLAENKLVARRAKAVKTYLVNLGIKSNRILIKSQKIK